MGFVSAQLLYKNVSQQVHHSHYREIFNFDINLFCLFFNSVNAILFLLFWGHWYPYFRRLEVSLRFKTIFVLERHILSLDLFPDIISGATPANILKTSMVTIYIRYIDPVSQLPKDITSITFFYAKARVDTALCKMDVGIDLDLCSVHSLRFTPV